MKGDGGLGRDVSSQVRICVERCVRKINRQTLSRARRAANALRNAELKVLKGQRSGKIYRKPFSRATYRASAPGEAPARRPGALRLSFVPYVESYGDRDCTIKAGIESGMDYAEILEKGSGRMAPRPYREPILEKAKPEIERIFKEPYKL